jgi:hypothetical protein
VLSELEWRAVMGWLRVLLAREQYDLPRKRPKWWLTKRRFRRQVLKMTANE